MQRATRAVYRVRRRVATGLAIGIALVFGYHAVLGHNGISAYAQKRSEDRVLAAEIQKLQTENDQLQQHVDHLKSDPDAIEHEARERLHYIRPGEIIYTLDDRPQSEPPKPDQHPSTSAPGNASPASRPPHR